MHGPEIFIPDRAVIHAWDSAALPTSLLSYGPFSYRVESFEVAREERRAAFYGECVTTTCKCYPCLTRDASLWSLCNDGTCVMYRASSSTARKIAASDFYKVSPCSGPLLPLCRKPTESSSILFPRPSPFAFPSCKTSLLAAGLSQSICVSSLAYHEVLIKDLHPHRHL
jgi:hypothetical protein